MLENLQKRTNIIDVVMQVLMLDYLDKFELIYFNKSALIIVSKSV